MMMCCIFILINNILFYVKNDVEIGHEKHCVYKNGREGGVCV